LKRIVRVVVVAAFVAAVLVIVSAPAFARPKFTQPVPTTVCSALVVEDDTALFEWRNERTVCWLTPPGLSNIL
jgi:hypothetical protein